MAHQEFTDDTSIPDEAELWRRVPPGHVIFDSNVGRKRPSKAAFDDHKDGSPMSVVLADLVLQSGRTPQHIVAGHDRFALAAFSVGLARSKQQGVVIRPSTNWSFRIGSTTRPVPPVWISGEVVNSL
jgi:hypothetical protein